MHDAWRVLVVTKVHGAGDFPASFTQDWLHFLQDMQIGMYVFKLPLVAQGFAQTFQIARWVVHIGFLDFDVIQFGRRVHRNVAGFSPFAHNLLMHLAFWWHIDDDVTVHLCLAP